MSTQACRVCGEDAGADPVHLREMMFGWREPFAYRRCHVCGSLSIDEIPQDIGRFYPAAYYANHARLLVSQDPPWRRTAIRALVGERLFAAKGPLLPLAHRLATVPRQIDEVQSLIDGAGLRSFDDAVLDVGCGAKPVRLAILRKLGFRQLRGLEPFIDHDLEYQGITVQRGQLADVTGRYRLVAFHHSFEHVPDPLATLRQARDRLEPDGRCLIRTPIMGTALWREYGSDWVELDAPRHIVVLSLLGLDRLAARAGFAVERITWESGDWEFIASEQYRRDIAMNEPASWFSDPTNGAFDADRLASFRSEARRLNAIGDAGRAAIWMRPIERPPDRAVDAPLEEPQD